jgi:hypothetical protein
MLRQCAWCGRRLGEAPPTNDASITHGMCQACRSELLTAFADGEAPLPETRAKIE